MILVFGKSEAAMKNRTVVKQKKQRTENKTNANKT